MFKFEIACLYSESNKNNRINMLGIQIESVPATELHPKHFLSYSVIPNTVTYIHIKLPSKSCSRGYSYLHERN